MRMYTRVLIRTLTAPYAPCSPPCSSPSSSLHSPRRPAHPAHPAHPAPRPAHPAHPAPRSAHQSTDKNFLVPVGGAVVATCSKEHGRPLLKKARTCAHAHAHAHMHMHAHHAPCMSRTLLCSRTPRRGVHVNMHMHMHARLSCAAYANMHAHAHALPMPVHMHMHVHAHACACPCTCVHQVSATYPGRASIAPVLDLFCTLLHLGADGWAKLLADRQVRDT